MKRVVLYTRVSSSDQHTETQICDLRPLAKARGYEIIGEYTDTISGAKAERPSLDKLMVRRPERTIRRSFALAIRQDGTLGQALPRSIG